MKPAITIPAPSGGVAPAGLAVADVNKDGKDDILFTVEPNLLAVALSNGDGTFATPLSFSGSGESTLSIGDLDGDGWPDVLAPGNDDGNVVLQWAKNNGDGKGTYGTFTMISELSNTGEWNYLADMNGDGTLDIVTFGASGIELLANDGKGNFSNAQELAGSTAWQAVLGTDDNAEGFVADLNGDGAPDLLLLDHDDGICVSLNQSHGASFSDPTCYKQTANNNPFGVTVGSFRGNGLIDIAIGGQGPDVFDIFLNKGGTTGTFESPAAVTVSSDPQMIAVDTVDINRDGKLDLVGFDTNGDGPYVSLGNGDGTFSTSLETYAAGSGGGAAYTLSHGHFTTDGYVGIAVIDQAMSMSLPSGGVQVLLTSCAE